MLWSAAISMRRLRSPDVQACRMATVAVGGKFLEPERMWGSACLNVAWTNQYDVNSFVHAITNTHVATRPRDFAASTREATHESTADRHCPEEATSICDGSYPTRLGSCASTAPVWHLLRPSTKQSHAEFECTDVQAGECLLKRLRSSSTQLI